MAIRKHKPTSAGRRFQSVQTFDEITATRPYRPLTQPLKKSGGRNNTGSITVWWRGGGHKRAYRIIDFKRDKIGVPARVSTIEYDPNRSARIALVTYADGEKRYILHPLGVKVGDTVVAGPDADILPGNTLPLSNIPLGTQVHNVELRPGKGGQLARSAGASVQVVAKDGKYVTVRLPSGETRLVIPKVRGDDRPGRQRRPRERSNRQGGATALARSPSPRLRQLHESGGSPPGRGRGPCGGRTAPGVAVGRSGQGLQDAQAEAVRSLHRLAQEEAMRESRS